jgi:hypothetical protein
MDLAAQVKTITGGAMAWGAIDAVGGALTGTLTDCVRVGGTVFVYGALSGVTFTGSVINAIFRDVTVKGFWLSIWLQSLSGISFPIPIPKAYSAEGNLQMLNISPISFLIFVVAVVYYIFSFFDCTSRTPISRICRGHGLDGCRHVGSQYGALLSPGAISRRHRACHQGGPRRRQGDFVVKAIE